MDKDRGHGVRLEELSYGRAAVIYGTRELESQGSGTGMGCPQKFRNIDHRYITEMV